MRSEEFNNILIFRTLAQKQHRTENVVKDLQDDNFLKNVHKALKIVRPIRGCFCFFDSNDARLHEVVPHTSDLEFTLKEFELKMKGTKNF